jgi:phosphate transport system permease protein
MTDAAISGHAHPASSDEAAARRRRRYAADRRLRLYGLTAISIALGMLGVLIASLVVTGYPAFTQTYVTVDFPISEENVDPNDLEGANWRRVVSEGAAGLAPGIESPREARAVADILTANTQFYVRDAVLADPSVIGGVLTLAVPAADTYDQLAKGLVDRGSAEDRRRLNDRQIALFDQVEEQGRVERNFNWRLFTNADSPLSRGRRSARRFDRDLLHAARVLRDQLPGRHRRRDLSRGVRAEEPADRPHRSQHQQPRRRAVDRLRLLGLAVFIQIFGLPRSAPLVGGLVLALMTLPTIIIVTRNALKAVPPSIREAAYGVGASRHQVVMHHVLPLALPGIMTGTIIGLAHALGETAPLLLIGMNAFITSAPGGVLDAATTLPTQVFIWADSPERGFVSRTSAGILVLLGVLVLMNSVAILLRQRLERTW